MGLGGGLEGGFVDWRGGGTAGEVKVGNEGLLLPVLLGGSGSGVLANGDLSDVRAEVRLSLGLELLVIPCRQGGLLGCRFINQHSRGHSEVGLSGIVDAEAHGSGTENELGGREGEGGGEPEGQDTEEEEEGRGGGG